MDTIRVLVADDHQIIRQCLRSLLEKDPAMAVIAEAKEGREAVSLAERHKPDVVLMDIEMPGLNGIEATRQISKRVPNAKVVALTGFADRRRIEQMMKAGGSGYVSKTAAFQELSHAIRTVVRNKVYLSPHVAENLEAVPGAKRSSRVLDKLSPKELEVLQLIAQGKATKEAAAILQVSVKTVETHRRNTMAKLDLHSVAELTKYALREGLASIEA